MTWVRSRIALAMIGVAATQVTCQVILTAPEGSELLLRANPEFIPANGGVSIISATLIEPAGTPVPDGTVVQFSTDLGRIEEQGKTNDGVARVKLVSDSRSGVAHISAVSGPASTAAGGEGEEATGVTVTIGNERVDRIILRANPPRITNSNSTHVFAALFDAFGNPVSNVPVFFSVTSSPASPSTEFFETTGPVYTNNNGEAENVLRTRRQTQGTATVTVTVPGPGTSQTMVIQIL